MRQLIGMGLNTGLNNNTILQINSSTYSGVRVCAENALCE